MREVVSLSKSIQLQKKFENWIEVNWKSRRHSHFLEFFSSIFYYFSETVGRSESTRFRRKCLFVPTNKCYNSSYYYYYYYYTTTTGTHTTYCNLLLCTARNKPKYYCTVEQDFRKNLKPIGREINPSLFRACRELPGSTTLDASVGLSGLCSFHAVVNRPWQIRYSKYFG